MVMLGPYRVTLPPTSPVNRTTHELIALTHSISPPPPPPYPGQPAGDSGAEDWIPHPWR
ncbi:hypothetical protein GBAR_LOCUS5010 [Geodia barretti]|uniref:Uncharacterized protein n=1 Tax=Geodia barretti TaxID=519541 RepID=A0AA35R9V4_GEOBA|nr:hypothetical protein GBAR_LOCUS5010 [Geodia barretti]